MNKFTKLTFAATTLFVGLQSYNISAETLRVGMECTSAPFNYRATSGELVGYDVDVAKGVVNILGDDLEYVCQKWDGMIPALLANKFDLVVASMSITEKRKKKIDFSISYRASAGRIIGSKAKNIKLFDDAGEPILANFKNIRVGLERASTYHDWFKAKVPDAKIVLYDSYEPLYLDLINGRIDAAMVNPMKAYLKFLSKDIGEKFKFISPIINEKKYFGIGVGIGLRKGQEKLLANLNKALAQMHNDGSLEKYGKKYFPFAIHK